MKIIKRAAGLVASLAMVFSVGCGIKTQTDAFAQENYSRVFEKDRIIDVKIDITEEDWQSMLDNPEAEEYHSADITVDGVKIENAGIRTKGDMTLRSLANSDSDRYSFRIKFNKYIKGQKLLDLDELVLNNNYSDPSYMREYLSYEAYTALGSKVSPYSAYANIYINGALFGFYLAIEGIDDSYLERVFGDDTGNLYKAEQGVTLQVDETGQYEKLELKSGDDTEKKGLQNMITILNNLEDGEKGNIEEILDVDSALQYIAVNTVLANYDSYNGHNGHNFYLYEIDGKFYVIPWDYNMSFAGFQGGVSAQTIPLLEPVSGVAMTSRPLIAKLLAVEEYQEKYLGYVRLLTEYLENFQTRVDELAEIIRPYIENDPTKFYTLEQFESAVTYNEETELAEQKPGMDMTQPDMGEGQTPPNLTDGEIPRDGQTMPEGMDRPGRGDMPDGMRGQRPEGQMQALPEKPAIDGQEEVQKEQLQDRGNIQGGFRGGGRGMMANTSIVTYAVKRLENIKAQLSGELAMTGNTTMQNGRSGPGENFGNRNGSKQQNKVSVILNGAQLQFDDQNAEIINDRAMVPVRKLMEALGASVDWDADTGKITITKDDATIVLTIGDETAYIMGTAVTMDTPAMVRNGRTLVPVRFISENLQFHVDWDNVSQTATISGTI